MKNEHHTEVLPVWRHKNIMTHYNAGWIQIIPLVPEMPQHHHDLVQVGGAKLSSCHAAPGCSAELARRKNKFFMLNEKCGSYWSTARVTTQKYHDRNNPLSAANTGRHLTKLVVLNYHHAMRLQAIPPNWRGEKINPSCLMKNVNHIEVLPM
jgi:hypothetical protein